MNQVRQVLEEVGNLAIGSDVTKILLARAETAERVLRQIIPYQRACAIFLRNYLLDIGTALIENVLHNVSPEIPQILQPKIREIKHYLEKLEGINNEIDHVIKEIGEKLKRRNYDLTRKEKEEVEKLLSIVEYKSEQLKNNFNAAEEIVASLSSDVASYKNNKGVSGWKLFLSVVAGAGAGALGVASWPVVAPAVAVFGGGAVFAVGRIAYEKEANNGEYAMVDVEIAELRSRLNKLKTAIQDKELDIAKVKYILRF
ncbi:uncharacterized protein [Montipora capricornis]|uniref:uncharacterized protein n=1 Tax=Montipora capricornis TaxID=246305 RepID=UPI0035F119DB